MDAVVEDEDLTPAVDTASQAPAGVVVSMDADMVHKVGLSAPFVGEIATVRRI